MKGQIDSLNIERRASVVQVSVNTKILKEPFPDKAMLKFTSNFFGELDVPHNKVIEFPSGILGFPDARRFVVLDQNEEIPFLWLHSIEEPAFAFIIMDPLIVKPEYRISAKRAEVADLGEPDEENLILLVILTIRDGNDIPITANLRAPLIINLSTMKGKQMVLQDESLPIQHPVI